ncbi:MAG TPA: RHS repeat-associated core domain-containing protein, partial [Woeseiaceae bacterium]|nr:RHS repeat-associated core domain-containing protein [Woeseiaceae bacterium]
MKAVVWGGSLSNATPTFKGGNDCEISENGSVIAYFPVRSGGLFKDFNAPSTLKTVIRPNGTSVKFELDNGTWVNRLDSTTSLVASGSDWVYTDANDTEETYNSSGQLVSITYRNGQTETLTYNLTSAQGGDDNSDTLDKVTGPFGHTITFAYDVNGILESITTPDGTIEYALDSNNNLVSVTYPDLSLRQYVYEDTDLPNHLTGIIDENNDRYATWAYDDSGRAVLSEHAGGQEEVQITYNSNGTTTMTTAGGASYTYTFTTEQGNRRLSAISGDVCSACAGGHVKSRGYDSNGYVSEETDWNDVVTKTARNTRGLVETLTEAFGESEQRVTTTQWHSSLRIPTSVTTPINTTTYTHDADGNVLTATVAGAGLSRVWTFTYNANGQVLTIDGPRTDVTDLTTLTYYSCSIGGECGQLESITDALGHVTDFDTYDSAGRLTKMTEPNGLETTYAYDARGRMLTKTETPTVGSARVTTLTYDDLGQVSTVTLPNSIVLNYTYDAAHYLTSIEDSLGNYINYTYDSMGDRTDEETFDSGDNLARAIEWTYDINRRVDTIESGGFVTDLAFDPLGNLTSETDPASEVTAHIYDALNRLDSTTDALNGVAEFTYDAHNNLTEVVAANGATTGFVYDALNNLTSESSPDRGTTTYTYDNAGNVATTTDARSVTVTYTYDALNRITSVSYPTSSENVTYTYDHAASNGLGRLRFISDQSGTITYSYDEFGNIASDARLIDGVTYTTAYEYDGANNITSITYPSGREVSYGRNGAGQITSATSTMSSVAKNVVSSASYEPFGPVAEMTYGNGLDFDYEYGLDGRIADILSTGVFEKAYSYDAAANIAEIEDSIDTGKTQDFTYDELRRLSDESPLVGDYAPKVLAHNPVAYWRLGETSGSTAYDSSGNGYDLPYVDTYTLGEPSLTGDSDKSLRIPTQGSGYAGTVVLTGVSVKALETWFQTDSTANYREIVTLQSTNSSVSVKILHHKSNGYVWVTGGQYGGGVVSSDGPVTSNEPHHVAVWYEAAANKTYLMIDGVVQQNTYSGNAFNIASPKAYIAAFQNGGNPYKRYLGYIDEVAVYDSAMTAASFADRFTSRIEYTYDANGNRTERDQGTASTVLAYQSNSNRLSTIDSVSVQHDLAGNRTSDQGGSRTFAYNDSGRLSEVFVNSSSVGSYVHNALGQRTKKTVGSTDTIFIFDIFGNLIAEHDDQGMLIRDYVWVDSMPVAQIEQGETFHYLHFDHLNTPRMASNDSQSIVWRWDSDAFGSMAASEDPDGNSTNVTVNLRFPGQYFDVETGLHYNYYRTYDPSTGRYLESD